MGAERPDESDIRRRLARVERQLRDLSVELRTRRLVVVDNAGRERIAAHVDGAVAEVRARLPESGAGASTEVLVFVASGGDGLPSGLGVQLWAAGNVVGELVWWDPDGPLSEGPPGPSP